MPIIDLDCQLERMPKPDHPAGYFAISQFYLKNCGPGPALNITGKLERIIPNSRTPMLKEFHGEFIGPSDKLFFSLRDSHCAHKDQIFGEVIYEDIYGRSFKTVIDKGAPKFSKLRWKWIRILFRNKYAKSDVKEVKQRPNTQPATKEQED
ncbi:hypothetical protein ACFLT7_07180 [candidate division KSB1 bacterium]